MLKSRAIQFVSIVITLCLILIVAVPLAALAVGAWNLQTVDPTEVEYTSIALDSNGYPHIAYYDATSQSLKYARWTGSAWNIQTVDGSAGNVGQYCSIALDSDNNPHISYWRNIPSELRHARWSGAAWDIGTVDNAGEVGRYTSIALDSGNNPHISYYDTMNYCLKYARWTGSAWNITPNIDGMGFGGATSIALDSSNNPHISYCVDFSALKYAHWDGQGWLTQVVDPAQNVGMYDSIALDSSGRPHISYCDSGSGEHLKYAHWTGSGWAIETVDATASSGLYTSIKLDSLNSPHISYCGQGNLKYAAWNGSAWSLEVADTPPPNSALCYTSLALNSSNYPHISYATGSAFSLHHAFLPVPPSPAITSINPDSGLQGQTLIVTITGANLNGTTAVGFGPGITVNGFTVDSATQVTVSITIAPDAELGPRDVVVTTPAGAATLPQSFTVTTEGEIGTGSHSSTVVTTTPQQPVVPPDVTPQSASISAKTVAPNAPVTVTADIFNKSTSGGIKKVTLYVNGKVESTQTVEVKGNGSARLTFTVSRSEPGEYSVYVDGIPAGSFRVELTQGNDPVFIFSLAMVALALIIGMIMLWRRQRGYN